MVKVPPDIERLIEQHLATGLYSTAEDVLRSALEQLDAHELASLRASLADDASGRRQPLSAIAGHLRQKYGFEKAE